LDTFPFEEGVTYLISDKKKEANHSLIPNGKALGEGAEQKKEEMTKIRVTAAEARSIQKTPAGRKLKK